MKMRTWARYRTDKMWPLDYCGGWTVNRKGETVMAYDPKSYELAEHFMKDEETETETQYKLLVDSLATAIQEAIEIWFAQQEANKPAEAPPSDEPQGPAAA